jgi:uncharacterized protein
MEDYLLRLGIMCGLAIAMLAPLLLLALATTKGARTVPVLLFLGLFVFDIALNLSPKLVSLPGNWADWNWQGKLFEMAWPLFFVSLVPGFSFARVGLQFNTIKGSWRVTGILGVIYAALFLAFMLLSSGGKLSVSGDTPTVVFQFTLPGLAEEFVFRGVLQTLLNEAFGRPWTIRGVRLGWGFPLVAALFGLFHGIWTDQGGHPHVSFLAMMFPTVIAVVLGWLRERAGSVWPCVLLHATVDGLAGLFGG